MASPRKGQDIRESTPKTFPEVPPPISQSGHDFTLQAVIEMHRSIGELSAKTDRLIADVQSQGSKIDAIRIRLAWVTGGAAVVGFIVSLGLAALKLLPFAANH